MSITEQNIDDKVIECVNLNVTNRYYNPMVKLTHKLKKPDPNTITKTNKVLCSKYYYTTGNSQNNEAFNIEDDSHLLNYSDPSKLHLIKYITKDNKQKQHECNIRKNVIDGDTHRSSMNRNLRERIYVEDGIEKIKTVVDIDPQFYKTIDGRPIKCKSSLKEYIDELKYSGLSYLKVGYMMDEVLRIEKKMLEEQNIYKNNCEKHNQYIDYFEKYLEENYNDSMEKINKSKEINGMLDKNRDIFNRLTIESGILQRRLYKLVEKNEEVEEYQEFLYHLSPVVWKEAHSFKKSALHLKDSDSDDDVIKYLIEQFNSSLNIKEPELYFTEPDQLKKILSNMKTQDLTNWSNSEKLIESYEKLNYNMIILSNSIKQEFRTIEELMEDLTNAIESEGKAAEDLYNTIMGIINSCFNKAVSSADVLKLNVCVHDVYEKLIFQNMSFETFDMLKTLESEYESNMRKLDSINLESVKYVKYESYAEDLRIMERANEAAKKLKKLETLYAHLKRALEG